MNIILFFIWYSLILFDVIITEYAIFFVKLKEKNPIMKNKFIRWFLNIFKVYLPLYLLFSSKMSFIFKIQDFVLLFSSIWYFLIGFNNVFFIRKNLRFKYIKPKNIERFIILKDKIKSVKNGV